MVYEPPFKANPKLDIDRHYSLPSVLFKTYKLEYDIELHEFCCSRSLGNQLVNIHDRSNVNNETINIKIQCL